MPRKKEVAVGGVGGQQLGGEGRGRERTAEDEESGEGVGAPGHGCARVRFAIRFVGTEERSVWKGKGVRGILSIRKVAGEGRQQWTRGVGGGVLGH